MKNTLKLISVFLALIVSGNLRANWQKDSTSTAFYANATCFVNSHLRFVLSGQYVYRTLDGGLNWQKDSLMLGKTKFSSVTYLSMVFINATTGFIQINTDDSLFIYKTNDAGDSWVGQVVGEVSANEIVKFISEFNWISFNTKYIQSTVNGGISWQKMKKTYTDTIISNVEIISNNEWYLFTWNTFSDVNIHQSTDQGATWQKLTTMHLFNNDSLFFPMADFVGIAKTSEGLTVLYNIYYAGCGRYYDHSMMFYIMKPYHGSWSVQSVTNKFIYAPRCLFYKNDTGYITTMGEIYKSVNLNRIWFKTFNTDFYKNGYIEGICYIDGVLYAYTNNRTVYRNTDPQSDKNLLAENTLSEIDRIIVFPNPADDVLKFKFSEPCFASCRITITDINGKLVFDETFEPATEIGIRTGFLSAGIYTYSVTNNNNKTYGKIKISR